MITDKEFCIECTGNNDREESIKANAIEWSEGNIGSKAQRFLADSGSMTHAICDESIKLENEITTNDKIQGFNGSAVYIKSKGNLRVKDTSTGSVVELKNARKSGAIKKNIISIGQLQSEGWILHGHDSILVLEKGHQLLRFVKSGEENLYYMDATVVSKAQQTNVMTRIDDDDSDDELPDLDYPEDDSSSGDDSDDDDEVLYLQEDDLEVYGMGIDNRDDGGGIGLLSVMSRTSQVTIRLCRRLWMKEVNKQQWYRTVSLTMTKKKQQLRPKIIRPRRNRMKMRSNPNQSVSRRILLLSPKLLIRIAS